jgi:thiamine-monophosphate kinase
MESDFIRWLRRRVPSHPRARVSIGDDAAVLAAPAGVNLLVTTDMLMDGVDFLLSRVDPRTVGRKALAVNLSDIAAMAGQPTAAFVSVALPYEGGGELAKVLYDGLLPLAEEFDVVVAGGDTNSWNGPLVISVTLLGEPTGPGPLTRQGALPGDCIVVTGEFGGSILGRHLDFVPRVREAQALHASYGLHAGIDVSDGLSLDLSRLAEESGCGALLDSDSIPISTAARSASESDGRPPLDHALADGEDFELILAVPADEARRLLADQPLAVKLTIIGQFVAEPGLWTTGATGGRLPLRPAGYEHDLSWKADPP